LNAFGASLVDQRIAALGLGGEGEAQGRGFHEVEGELEQGRGLARLQFELHLAEGHRAVAGLDGGPVHHGLDGGAIPLHEKSLPLRADLEGRLDAALQVLFFQEIAQGRALGGGEIEGRTLDGGLPLAAVEDEAAAGRFGLDGLDPALALPAHATDSPAFRKLPSLVSK
jgi:hypothetical protein